MHEYYFFVVLIVCVVVGVGILVLTTSPGVVDPAQVDYCTQLGVALNTETRFVDGFCWVKGWGQR